MADEALIPEGQPATEVENAPETSKQEEVSQEKVEETKPEPTMAELLKEEAPKPNLVPEAALIGEKKGRKEAEKRIKELEAQIAEGATRQEVSDDIDSILNEYGLDDTNKQFFNKLVKVMEAKAEARAEAKAAERLKPLEEKERAAKLDQVFKKHFTDALESMPEFKDIANEQVIKTLSLAPENANKTFTEIIEETYGNAVSGKRTIETTTPGGGKAPEPIDFERANKDAAYAAQLLANPDTKKAYNDELMKRITGR